MAKYLVTGGAGFIGSAISQALIDEKHEVIIIDTLLRGNKISNEYQGKYTLVKEDVRNQSAIIEYSKGCEAIFHLAAVLGVDIVADNPVETMEVEVEGTKNVCTAAQINGIKKIIYASTSGIYGHSAMEQAVTEEVMVDPRTSYAMAKRYNEIYLAAIHEEKGINTISLRFFNVYGPKQDNRMVVPRFFEQAISNQPITVFGDGMQTRDFTYIDDTVDACLDVLNKVSGSQIINVCNENEENIEKLALRILETTGSKSQIKYIDAPKKRYDYEVERRVGNSEKLGQLTGRKPSTRLDEGLMKIFETITGKQQN